MSDLKPCPFCGSEAFLDKTCEYPYIGCETCSAMMESLDWNEEDILDTIKAWNTRTPKGSTVSEFIKPTDCLHYEICKFANDGGCFDGCDYRIDKSDSLESENKRLSEALSVYARRYDGDKCWNWSEQRDDFGSTHFFDWIGDEQDEPWEVAENALKIEPTPDKPEQPKEADSE